MTRKKNVEFDPEPADVTLTRRQLGTVYRALDFYSRVLAGQWTEVESVVRMNYPSDMLDFEQCGKARRLLDVAKALVVPELENNGQLGVGHPKLPRESAWAYELCKWIGNWLARNQEEPGVMADPPLRLTDQPRPDIRDAGCGDVIFSVAGQLAAMLGDMGVSIRICRSCGKVLKEEDIDAHTSVCKYRAGADKDISGEKTEKAGNQGPVVRQGGRSDSEAGVPRRRGRPCGTGKRKNDIPVRKRRKVL